MFGFKRKIGPVTPPTPKPWPAYDPLTEPPREEPCTLICCDFGFKGPPSCLGCRHLDWQAFYFWRTMRCKAFPHFVPDRIWRGHDPHLEPFPGDHGIQFEAWDQLPPDPEGTPYVILGPFFAEIGVYRLLPGSDSPRVERWRIDTWIDCTLPSFDSFERLLTNAEMRDLGIPGPVYVNGQPKGTQLSVL